MKKKREKERKRGWYFFITTMFNYNQLSTNHTWIWYQEKDLCNNQEYGKRTIYWITSCIKHIKMSMRSTLANFKSCDRSYINNLTLTRDNLSLGLSFFQSPSQENLFNTSIRHGITLRGVVENPEEQCGIPHQMRNLGVRIPSAWHLRYSDTPTHCNDGWNWRFKKAVVIEWGRQCEEKIG